MSPNSVSFGRHLVRKQVIARHPAAGHDAAQVHRAADSPARLVQRPANAAAPRLRIGKYFGAIQCAPARVMRGEEPACGHFSVTVQSAIVVPFDDQRTCGADHFVSQAGDDLAQRKDSELAFQLLHAPSADAGIDAVLDFLDLRQVCRLHVSHDRDLAHATNSRPVRC